MVFTEEAEASNIPTLHLSANLPKDSFDDLSTYEKLGAELGAGVNALNALQAREEFKAGAPKSPGTLVDTSAYKNGMKEALEAWPHTTKELVESTKKVVKLGAMDGAKVAGKSFLKKLPLIGLVAGIGFGIARAMEGDWKGAGMEVASGAFSLVPGIGTAASVAIDAALLEKDTGLLSHGVNKLLGKEKQENVVSMEPEETNTMDMNICNTTAGLLENNAENITLTSHKSVVSGEYGRVEASTCTMNAELTDTKAEDASIQLECMSVKTSNEDSVSYHNKCKDTLTENHTYKQEEVDQAAQHIYDSIAAKYGNHDVNSSTMDRD